MRQQYGVQVYYFIYFYLIRANFISNFHFFIHGINLPILAMNTDFYFVSIIYGQLWIRTLVLFDNIILCHHPNFHNF